MNAKLNRPTPPARRGRSRLRALPATKRSKRTWCLCLYVAGQTPRSLMAFANLKRLCEEHLPGCYRIEVVDLARNPALAQKHQIVALPTLVRKLPPPMKRVIGDLSNAERVQVGIDLMKSEGAA